VDELLRGLERRYQETNAAQDGITYLLASIRASHTWDLDDIPRRWLHDKNVERALQNSISTFHTFELNGISLRQHILDLAQAAGRLPIEIFPRPVHGNDADSNASLDIDDDRYGPLVVAMCLCLGEHDGNPITKLGLITLTRHTTGCKFCQNRGEHLCTAFKHPYAGGYELPDNEQKLMGERLRDYPWLSAERHDEWNYIEPTRTWIPEQNTRQMSSSWRYRLHLLLYEQTPRDDDNHFRHPATYDVVNNYWNNEYWYLNEIKSLAAFRDFASEKAILDKITKTCDSNKMRTTFHRRGAYLNYKTCILFPVIDPRRHIPTEDPHQPIETAPIISQEPCGDAMVLAPLAARIRAWQMGQVPADYVLEMSAHTACGHGVTIVKNQLVPLCPYRWSDTWEPVYDKCVQCAAPIVLGSRTSACPRCQQKWRFEFEAERGNVPPPDPYYECRGCAGHYDSRWEAEECEETTECLDYEYADYVEPGYE